MKNIALSSGETRTLVFLLADLNSSEKVLIQQYQLFNNSTIFLTSSGLTQNIKLYTICRGQ
ncbi:MAG: hypothetical protein WBA93_04650, partial [Microcoleaceae cyanobacterium]